MQPFPLERDHKFLEYDYAEKHGFISQNKSAGDLNTRFKETH